MPKPRIAVPNTCWPALDGAGWAEALRPGDQFDPPGLAAGWKFNTHDTNERAYGHWLKSLLDLERLEPDLAPHLRCTPVNLAAYVQSLKAQGLAPFTVLSRIHGLNCVLRAICPGADLRHLDALEHRLKAAAVPVRNKADAMIPPGELFRAAMRELDRQRFRDSIPAARRYRDALIVIFLLYRPIRLANLAALALGHHLVRRNGTWEFLFSATETKNGRPLRFALPATLLEAFERYLAVQRPLLLKRGDTTHLWVSSRGTPLSQEAIYGGVCGCTERLVGRHLNPHLFRDIAATFVSEESPGDRGIVADILGHTTLATSATYYDHAGTLRAQQRLVAIIDELAWGDESPEV